MKYKQLDTNFIVSFERGEFFPEALIDLAVQMGWHSGSITGLGAVMNVTIAYFDLQQKAYRKIPVEGIVELVNLTGNLSSLDNIPFWHLHAAVSDPEGNLKGGHLISFEVAITVECVIVPCYVPINRSFNNELGLNLLNL